MSIKNAINTGEKENLLAKQNDVAPTQCATAAVTETLQAATECTTASETRSEPTVLTLAPLVDPSTTGTMLVDENDSASGNQFDIALATSSAGGSTRSSSSGGGNGADAPGEKRRSSGEKSSSRRKTRRGKTKRGKRSSSQRAFSKSPWKFQVPNLRKRRSEVTLGSTGGGVIPLIAPLRQLDHPLLVPYNTNRFLMEDHMPHVLTPSEDEEEFLTKEFSSVYEDARSERLEGLSKSQLIQEYLQLEANFEQVTRRYNAAKSFALKEETESAAGNTATKDPTEGGSDRRRLEDRVRELTAENLELRRQLEHASRIGMVLSAKSSPRNNGNPVERMDSSSCTSSEDSESDSSTSSSSSTTGDDDDGDGNGKHHDASSSSSMSGDEEDQPGGAPFGLLFGAVENPPLPLVGEDVSFPMDETRTIQQNGIHPDED
ncbi:protein HEXIM2 isoform X2 [Malaya genurostris]|uniref:protein HEXIM2 isoform X2 n=1 Tax=Malaya genurostris TaxID=325434 RepID=UPI0026F3BDDB|nr:protein HEXIM2 isoform X2 [Malaya genurostris]